MSKKLENNGLWESSRMMLPEHKERILQANHQLERRTKPVLDMQKREEINELLSEACQTGEEITLVLWDPYENRTVVGTIVKLDILAYRIFIAGQWVKLAGIVDVLRTG
ncbi:YolD-like family protein [Cohnella sp.]|uniref:YolD-like family protein n=1 Tax=Cohnella sp. TaxID=1883426 RepID=UPI003565288C